MAMGVARHHMRRGMTRRRMAMAARFHLRGIASLAGEWSLTALACNRRRLHRLRMA